MLASDILCVASFQDEIVFKNFLKKLIGSYLPTMHTEVVPPHLTNVLCVLIVDIF